MAPASTSTPPSEVPKVLQKNLTRKVAIVTGAASGFGEAITRQLAARGCIVVLADRDAARGEKLAAELDAQYGGELDIGFFPFVQADLSTLQGVQKVFDECLKRFATVDIVINNAGLAHLDEAFFDGANTDWTTMVRLNIDAVIYGTQLAIKEFLESNKAGVVINTASGAGFTPLPSLPVYAATKAAVYHFSRSIGLLYPKIRVHAVCPGAVKTNLPPVTKNLPGSSDFNSSKAIQASLKIMSTDDVADAMMYAICDDTLEPGVGVTAFGSGIEVIQTETRAVRKIKEIRYRESKAKAKM